MSMIYKRHAIYSKIEYSKNLQTREEKEDLKIHQ